jgi:hypothetical protein
LRTRASLPFCRAAACRDVKIADMERAAAAPGSYTPTVAELDEARKRFLEYEPRDLFYRVASELIELALTGKTSITVAEALAVLLQTWNAQYYQYRPFTLQHFADIEALLQKHSDDTLRFRSRTIESVSEPDLPIVESLFNSFEQVLGPVGAAKSLHLLAPKYFPLWDRAIAKAYRCELGNVGANGANYSAFFLTAALQARTLSRIMPEESNLLKRIDEFNYCKHTKGWM